MIKARDYTFGPGITAAITSRRVPQPGPRQALQAEESEARWSDWSRAVAARRRRPDARSQRPPSAHFSGLRGAGPSSGRRPDARSQRPPSARFSGLRGSRLSSGRVAGRSGSSTSTRGPRPRPPVLGINLGPRRCSREAGAPSSPSLLRSAQRYLRGTAGAQNDESRGGCLGFQASRVLHAPASRSVGRAGLRWCERGDSNPHEQVLTRT